MSKIKQLQEDMYESAEQVSEEVTESTFKRVKDWNDACGKEPLEKGSEAYWKALEDQLGRIMEELQETIDKGLKQRNFEELLDGGCDLDVTVAGFNGMLNMAYQGAINSVLDNNDEKIHTVHSEALKTLAYYEQGGEHCYIHSGNKGYVVKRVSDDKIMKPYNHPRVDLTPFI